MLSPVRHSTWGWLRRRVPFVRGKRFMMPPKTITLANGVELSIDIVTEKIAGRFLTHAARRHFERARMLTVGGAGISALPSATSFIDPANS